MKTAIPKVETLAERYIILDSLLFKIVTTPQERNSIVSYIRDMHRQDSYTLSF